MIKNTISRVHVHNALCKIASGMEKRADWLDSLANGARAVGRFTGTSDIVEGGIKAGKGAINAGKWVANNAAPIVNGARMMYDPINYVAGKTVQNAIGAATPYVKKGVNAAIDAGNKVGWGTVGLEYVKSLNPATYLGEKAGQGLSWLGGKAGEAVGNWWGGVKNDGKNAVLDQQIAQERRIAKQRQRQSTSVQTPSANTTQSQNQNAKLQPVTQPVTPAQPQQPRQQPQQPAATQSNPVVAGLQKGVKEVGDAAKNTTDAVFTAVDRTANAIKQPLNTVGLGLQQITSAKSLPEAGRATGRMVRNTVGNTTKAVADVARLPGDIARNTVGDNTAGRFTQGVLNVGGNVVEDAGNAATGFYDALTGTGRYQGDTGDRWKAYGDEALGALNRTFNPFMWGRK